MRTINCYKIQSQIENKCGAVISHHGGLLTKQAVPGNYSQLLHCDLERWGVPLGRPFYPVMTKFSFGSEPCTVDMLWHKA